MKRRIISLLLCLALIIIMIPASVFAEEKKAEAPGYIDCDGKHSFSFASGSQEDVFTCYYYDKYFTDKEEGLSAEYNESLATMSLCLAMAGFAGGGKWTTNVTASNPKFKYARNMLIGKINEAEDVGLGFTDFAVNKDWANAPGKDTIGVVAARKILSDGSNLVAVSVRGAGYKGEWASNLTLGEEGDHAGFAKGRDDVLAFMDEYIDSLKLEPGSTRIWITGYSRGAAVANMVAGAIDDGHEFPAIGTIAQENLYAYTFSTPMGAMEDSANGNQYANIHNVVNYNDMVALVAPEVWDFDRYNSDEDVYLPNKAESYNFDESLEKMLPYYNQFKHSKNNPYNIKEDREINLITEIDWEEKDGELVPIIKYETRTETNRKIITDMIELLADGLLEDRENYCENYQETVRNVLWSIFGGESAIKEESLKELLSGMTLEKICKMGEPMLNNEEGNSIQQEEKRQEVKQNIQNDVGGILNNPNAWKNGVVDNKTINVITDLLWNILREAFNDLILGDGSQLSELVAFAGGLADKSIIAAHYPELNLAWMMSMDSNYDEITPAEEDNPGNNTGSITASDDKTGSPGTGDDSDLYIYAALTALICALCIIAITVRRRNYRNNKAVAEAGTNREE